MAPKIKKNISSWLVCEMCNVILTAKDLQKHIDNSCIIASKEFLLHGFINKQVLFSTLGEISLDVNTKNIPESESAHYVFLSESAMQLCDISIGSHVLVKGHNGNVIRRAWPMREKTLTAILMTEDGMELFGEKVGNRLSVEKLKRPPYPAAVIKIEPLYPSCLSNFPDSVMDILSKAFLGKILMDGNVLFFKYFGKKLKFRVSKCYAVEPKVAGLGDYRDDTEIIQELKYLGIRDSILCASFTVFIDTKFEISTIKKAETSIFSNIGGLNDVISKLKEFMEVAWNPFYRNLGIEHGNGCLLFGPPGTGKTLLVKSLSTQFPITYIEILGSEVYSKFLGEAEAKLRGYFHLAKQRSPSLIFIDELDALCPYNAEVSSSTHHQEQRITATLITLLDGLKSDRGANGSLVLVIGATSHLSALDPRLRCPGRLDSEIEISVPEPHQRLDILQKISKQWHENILLADESILKHVAAVTHGHVGADLASICLHAVSCALKRTKLEVMNRGVIVVQEGDFLWAVSQVKPSAMREVLVEVPNVRWADIGGQQQLKLKLQQAVEWPLRHPEAFERLGILPPKGLLMFGPPGCSKTMIAKALATESGLNFISIKGPELFSKWVGESERAVREVFRRARQVAPAVVFFDELDALGGERGAMGSSGGANVQERVLSQLLTEMDGVTPLSQVTVVAATNRPDRIDKALLRPGRLDQIVYVPLPDADTRREILELQFKKSKFSDEVLLGEVVDKTDGYSGAEVLAVCHEAGLIALEEDMFATCIRRCHLEKALNEIKPRTPFFLIELYEKYLKNN